MWVNLCDTPFCKARSNTERKFIIQKNIVQLDEFYACVCFGPGYCRMWNKVLISMGMDPFTKLAGTGNIQALNINGIVDRGIQHSSWVLP